jgi:HPt (histidine-containing phosphotransfer) domain-containing protein
VSGASEVSTEGLLPAAGGDPELARELAHLFLEECERLLAEVLAAGRSQDAGMLEESAHALRGSAITLGFGHVADLALEIEMHARTGLLDPVEIGARLDRLSAACHAAERAVRVYLGEEA